MSKVSDEAASGARQAEFESALAALKVKKTISRIWQKDPSVWSDQPEHHQIIANSLGWLTVPRQALQRAAELKAFAQEIREAGFTHAVVLGMGGSSLCPEVLRQSFGPQEGYPELLVLDSTVPAAVTHLEA